MRLLAPFALALCLVLLVPAAAGARVSVGIGDQHASSYRDPGLRKLHLKTARLSLAWDWYKDPYLTGQADAWVAAVRSARMRPLISLNRSWRPSGRYEIPPMTEYVHSFRLLRSRYPHVREFSAWNEPNAKEQPFYRKPALAARYFNAMRRAAGRRITVVAGDIKDGRAMTAWLRSYKRKVHGAKIWALHNYKDATSKYTRGTTRAFVRIVHRPVWLTETGGIRSRGGLTGQARSVKRIFALAHANHAIKRIYFYEWRAVRHSHWDSAFLSATGKHRPAYHALRQGLRHR
jgi:Glycosyl hydrolase catalytic core